MCACLTGPREKESHPSGVPAKSGCMQWPMAWMPHVCAAQVQTPARGVKRHRRRPGFHAVASHSENPASHFVMKSAQNGSYPSSLFWQAAPRSTPGSRARPITGGAGEGRQVPVIRPMMYLSLYPSSQTDASALLPLLGNNLGLARRCVCHSIPAPSHLHPQLIATYT
jgi:hypothetical protein